MTDVELKTDSMLIVNAINMRLQYCLEVDIILHECRIILDARPNLSISFVKKHANNATHLLARVPCMVNSFNMFLSPPSYVLETLRCDSMMH